MENRKCTQCGTIYRNIWCPKCACIHYETNFERWWSLDMKVVRLKSQHVYLNDERVQAFNLTDAINRVKERLMHIYLGAISVECSKYRDLSVVVS